MDATVWWVLLVVVGLIVGPFAALRAVSALRGLRGGRKISPAEDEQEAREKKDRSFW